MFRKKNIIKASPKKEHFNEPKQMHSNVNIYSISIVLDGQIQEIIRTEARLWALLMSDPKFVDLTENESKPMLGWEYNEETMEFTNPNEKN
jgi:hypothetical protein